MKKTLERENRAGLSTLKTLVAFVAVKFEVENPNEQETMKAIVADICSNSGLTSRCTDISCPGEERVHTPHILKQNQTFFFESSHNIFKSLFSKV